MRNTTYYNISGTKFYRLASRSFFGKGTNLQNIDKYNRKLYIADDGYVLNQRDQSGAEALIVAYLCRDGNFRSLFKNGIKPHTYVALHLFKHVWQEKINEGSLDIQCSIDELCNTPIPLLNKNPYWKPLNKLIKSSDDWQPSQRYYYLSKQTCHSGNYGVTPNPFILNILEKSKGKVVVSKTEGERFLETYHGLFPEIRADFQRNVEAQVRETRMVFNLLGYPIIFTGDLDQPNAIKECFSSIPQSTVACITRRAVTKMQQYIEAERKDWDILQDNHDSFVVQCKQEEHMECHSIMKSFLNYRMKSPFDGEGFNMQSEGATGKNWAPYNSTTNPDGLQEVSI